MPDTDMPPFIQSPQMAMQAPQAPPMTQSPNFPMASYQQQQPQVQQAQPMQQQPMQQQQPMMQQPQQMPGYGIGAQPMWSQPAFVSPPQVAASDETLKKLDLAKQKYLDKIIAGPSPMQRGEETGASVFGKLIAPAMAMFGKGGTSAAGVALINDAKQQVKDARLEQMQNENHNVTALKGITDIFNTAGVKPALDYFKAQIAAAKVQGTLQQGADKNAEAKRFHDIYDSNKQKQNTRLAEAVKSREKLAALGLQEKYDYMAMVRDNHEQADKRLRDLAALNADLRSRGMNLQQSAQAQRLAQELKMYNDKAMQAGQFHNDEIYKWTHEVDPKTGKYKHLDANGQPLNAADYTYTHTPVGEDEVPQPGSTQPTDEDYAAALQHVQQTPTYAPAPQAPASVQQMANPGQQPAPGGTAAMMSTPGNPSSSGGGALTQQYGSGIEGAKALWRSMPPDKQGAMAKKFFEAFHKNPWDN